MKFSELSTDRALDVMCELTPYVDSIVQDAKTIETLGKVVTPKKEINKYGSYAMIAGRVTEFLPILLKDHRPDVYGILSIMSEKSAAEIAAQPLLKTIQQAKEIFQDDGMMTFFKSSAQQAQSGQSAPSADSHA